MNMGRRSRRFILYTTYAIYLYKICHIRYRTRISLPVGGTLVHVAFTCAQ